MSSWWMRQDRALLSGFLVSVLLAWAFVEVADGVAGHDTLGVDRYLLTLLSADPAWPDWIVLAVVDLTALGGMAVLTLITLLSALYLGVARRLISALWLALAVAGGLALSHSLKLLFERPRPDVVEHIVAVSTTSFPSGHATNSAVVYLTLGAIIAREHGHRPLRIYVIAAGIFLTVLVGSTRLILGVHWPSDVLAGWILGAGWASLCASVNHLLSRRQRGV